MIKHPIVAGLLGAALVAGAGILGPSMASASVAPSVPSSHPGHRKPPESFATQQHVLEHQLADRVGELGRLGQDVAASKTLTAGDQSTLVARLAAETTSIQGLVSKVPGDTTFAELRADRTTMYRTNRVYAVMVPQVFEVIEADATSSEANSLAANEPGLAASVTSLVGQPGYRAAARADQRYVTSVTQATLSSRAVAARVLALTPSGYPHTTGVFVRSNHALLEASLAIAHANYDATLVGLASGGYTG